LAWDNYFSHEMAMADAEVKEAKNKLEVTLVKLTGGAKKRTHALDADERVLASRSELQEAEQTAGVLKTTHSIFANRLKVVSRAIELRKMEWEKSQRESGIRSGLPHIGHSKFGAEKSKK
jgi:hypothetical protein